MRISETPRFRKWLDQFHSADRAAARLLVDALVLISAAEFEHGLMTLVEQWADELEAAHRSPIALYPVREFDESTKEFFAAGYPPTISSSPGSEGRIASIITRLSRERRGTFLSQPSLQEMRETKCRFVLWLDDLSGSGTRILKYARLFMAHRTIRSWLSLRYIGTGAAAFAFSEVAQQMLTTELKPNIAIRFSQRPRFGLAAAAPHSRALIEQLCQKYGKMSGSRYALGYKNANTGLIFEHGCPNDAPGILWQGNPSNKRHSWTPLFGPGRVIPRDLRPCFADGNAHSDLDDLAVVVGQKRLADGHWWHLTDPESWGRIIVLATISRHTRGVHHDASLNRRLETLIRLHELAYIPIPDCQEIVSWLVANNLLDQDWRLTESGRKVLQYARRTGYLPEGNVEPKNGYYFPLTLR